MTFMTEILASGKLCSMINISYLLVVAKMTKKEQQSILVHL